MTTIDMADTEPRLDQYGLSDVVRSEIVPGVLRYIEVDDVHVLSNGVVSISIALLDEDKQQLVKWNNIRMSKHDTLHVYLPGNDDAA
jgi:hypothetical protein